MTRDRSDDIRAAWERVRRAQALHRAALACTTAAEYTSDDLTASAREYLRLAGSVGQAACYAALGGIEAEIARETCEELVR